MPALRLSALGLAVTLLSSAAAALTTCTPSLPAPSAGADGLVNVFAMSRGASRACPTSSGAQSADALSPSCLDAAVASWEYVPPSPSWPKSGGALYLVRSSPPTLCGSLSSAKLTPPTSPTQSGTDTPEDGAFYIVERASLDPAHEDPVWTLRCALIPSSSLALSLMRTLPATELMICTRRRNSLGSQDPGVQCVSAPSKLAAATMGSCDELEAEVRRSPPSPSRSLSPS